MRPGTLPEGHRPGAQPAQRPTRKRQDRLARFRFQRPPRFKRYLQVRP